MKRAVRGNVMAETAIGVITNLLDFQPVGIEVHGNMTSIFGEFTSGVFRYAVMERNCGRQVSDTGWPFSQTPP